MTFTLDTWQIITIICTLVGAFATVVKFAISHLLTLFNERRSAVSEQSALTTVKIERIETDLDNLYREFLKFQTELSNTYTKREDYVQAISEMRSKLDAIAFNYQRGNPQ
jgi:septation ring formation regulator EzrA